MGGCVMRTPAKVLFPGRGWRTEAQSSKGTEKRHVLLSPLLIVASRLLQQQHTHTHKHTQEK